MKRPASDKKLWQHKMQQLPLEGDEHVMWQNMQALLDESMPVNSSGGSNPGKNLPGSSTIISAIIIVAALAILLLHFTGVFHPDKKQKTESKITKVQADSVNVMPNNPRAAGKRKDITAKNSSANNVTSAENESDNGTRKIGAAGKKNVPSKVKKNIANIAGSANTTVPVGKRNCKLPASHADNKISGAAKQTNNSADRSMNNSGKRHASHSLVSDSQNSFAYLASAAARNKTGHYLGQLNKASIHQQNVAKNNAGPGVNYHAPNGNRMGAGNNSNSTIANKQKSQDQNTVHNGLLLNKTDSTAIAPATNHVVNKQAAQNNTAAKNQASKNGKPQSKPTKKQTGNSKFELDLRLGLNTGTGSSTYAGITAGYYIMPRLGILIGANVMPARSLSGSYSKSNLKYTTDTGLYRTHETGKIIISGSRKLYTIDVPIIATYQVNKLVSVYGGPVLSIPVKANAAKNNLTLLTNSNDTAKREVAPYVTSTAINNKFNFGLSGGVRLNFNRLFISAGYMQDMQTYTIGSGLGSGKINRYHTVQFGIGYQLFKPKTAKP